MTSLRLSQVRRKVAGSLASAFQKLLIQSVLRDALISSNTARTSGLAALSSISGTLGILTSRSGPGAVRRPAGRQEIGRACENRSAATKGGGKTSLAGCARTRHAPA